MKIRMLSWNVRGANDRDKRKVIKALIKKNKVDLVCLQETKIQEMSRGLVHNLGVGRFLEWGTMNSRGAVGGIVGFFGIIGCWNWLNWKQACSQSLAILRIVRMASGGLLLRFMTQL